MEDSELRFLKYVDKNIGYEAIIIYTRLLFVFLFVIIYKE